MLNDYWQTVYGWFDFENVYDIAIEHLKDGDIAVELGTFLGKSTCYFAQRLKESKKQVKFYACDVFDGSKAPFMPPEWEKPFYDVFLENLKKQEVFDLVIPFKGNSLDFVSEFKDNSISFIYIDDDHREEHFIKELNAWYPKMKSDGIMAGHDFYAYPEIGKAVTEFTEKNNLKYEITSGTFSHSWRFVK